MKKINLFIKSVLLLMIISILLISTTFMANATLLKTKSKGILQSDSSDFTFNNGTITYYSGKEQDLVIPSTFNNLPVTSIGDFVFANCVNLKSVTIPNSVMSISISAFSNCRSLKNISVDKGNKVYSSENGVLFNKNKTELIKCPEGKTGSYTIPNGVTVISDDSFSFCTGVTSVKIPLSVSIIKRPLFTNCNALRIISVDKRNKTFSSDNGVLFNKSKNKLIEYPKGKTGNYTIPNGVTTIGDGSFYNCKRLTNVSIPLSVVTINIQAFGACEILKNISVDKRNKVYSSDNGVLFNKNKTELIEYPGGKIGDYTVPNTVTCIKEYAFAFCLGLSSITIPTSVTTIGDQAFIMCSGLTSVTINNSSNLHIGDGAFYYCTEITSFYFTGDAPKDIKQNVFPHDGDCDPRSPDFKIYYDEGRAGFTTPLWNGFPCYPKK